MSDAKITLSAEDKTRAAFGDVKRNLLSLQQSALGINQAFGGVASTLGSAFAGLSLTAFTKSVADGLERLNDIKDATGSTVENISALEDVALRTGASIDDVSAALLKFNGALNDSKAGGGNDNVFKALGLDVAELKRLDPAQALLKTAVAFSKFADDGEKARAMQQVFGKATKDLAGFLNDLAEAGQLNATATQQQADEADKFNKQLAAMSKNSLDVARSLVSDLLPSLNGFLEKITAINRSGGLFAAFGAIGKELRSDVVGDELKRVVSEIESIQTTINRQGGDSYLERKLVNLRARAAELSKESQTLSEWLKKFASQAYPFVDPAAKAAEAQRQASRPTLRVPSTGAQAVAPKTEKPMFGIGMDLIPESLKEARKLIDDADVNRVARLREQLQELIAINNANPGQAGVIPAIEGVVQKINELDPEYRAAIKAQQDFAALLERTPLGRMQKLRDEVVQLEQAFQDGYFGLVGSTEAVQAFQAAVADLTKGAADDVRKAVDNMDEFSKEAARNIQGALGTTLKSTLRGDFDSIGELWGNLLLDMAAEAAAAQLGRVLMGDFASSGNIGGLIGDGLGWLSAFGIGRADGGPVGARSLQRVNERGFEVFTDSNGGDWLMTGARGGMVTPNSQVAVGSSAGGAAPVVVVNLVNNFASGVSRQEMAAYGQVIKQQTMAAVADAQRRGRSMQGA